MASTQPVTILLEGALVLEHGIRLEVACLGRECEIALAGYKGAIALPCAPKEPGGRLSAPASRLPHAAKDAQVAMWGWVLSVEHCVVDQVLFHCRVEFDGDEASVRK